MSLTVQEVFDNADSCGDHPLGIDAAILAGAQTIAALGGCRCGDMNASYDRCDSYCDSQSFAVAKLADGRYFAVQESSDSSGHG